MSNTGESYPILCNQENFILNANRYKIKQCLDNEHIIFKPAVKNTHDNGRPKNGMFIAVPLAIKEKVTDVSPHHWRVQAVILHTQNNRILLVNTYFPTDPKVQAFDMTDLFTTLSAINDVLQRNNFDSVVWAGDINADFVRRTRFTSTVDSFIVDHSFNKSRDRFDIDFTHVYEIDNVCYSPF